MYHKTQKLIALLMLGFVSFSFQTSVQGNEQDSRELSLQKLEKRIQKYSPEKQKRLYTSMLSRIDVYMQRYPSNLNASHLLTLKAEFADNISLLQNYETRKIVSESTLILKFTHGGNHEEYIQTFSEKIKKSQSVFVFRNKENLSRVEIQNITQALKKINPFIYIFIDQEGGNINRYVDFPTSMELSEILHHDFIDSRVRLLSPEERKIFEGTFSAERLYYYPSLATLKKSYDKIIDEKSKQYFLEIAAYIRLVSLKSVGINTYGLVLDLDFGNPVIGGKERSFSSLTSDYKKLIDAHLLVSEISGIMLYGKHFPGHGVGEIDSHKGVLDISTESGYTRKNMEVFQYFLSQNLSVSRGMMVGHMYVSLEYLGIFTKLLDTVDFIITDDLGMQGYILATGEEVEGKFFTTDTLSERKNLIKIDISSPTAID